jgi:NitT/TauT family transport system ATP-binding protein
MRRKRAEYVARAEALLASVGLGGQGAKFPWELSGGMQQRTSLCRALIHEPQLLMLDEPFAALDAFTREELWCVIRDLHAVRKITVILVTHDLREAVFLSDRVFVMSSRPGRVIAERRIEFPQPRDLEVTFTAEFQGIVHELREHIVRARQ